MSKCLHVVACWGLRSLQRHVVAKANRERMPEDIQVDACPPYSHSWRPRLCLPPPPVRPYIRTQTADTSEKLRVSTANATHMLQAEARRRALAASADGDEHSDDDFVGDPVPSPFASPRASMTSVKSHASRASSIQGGAGGAGGNDEASTRESTAAARRRSLAAQLARYAGDLKNQAYWP